MIFAITLMMVLDVDDIKYGDDDVDNDVYDVIDGGDHHVAYYVDDGV